MDLTSGLKELDEMDAREQLKHGQPKSTAAKIWAAIF